MRDFNDDDRVGIVFTNAEFPDRPLAISIRKRSQITASVILDTLGRVLQSNASFFTNNRLTLAIDRVLLPVGRGRTALKGDTYEQFCKNKRGIVVVNNKDNHCLAYALALGIAYHKDKADFKKLKLKPILLKVRGRELCRAFDVNLSNGGSLEHVKRFQDNLEDFTIVVYNNRGGSETYFEGPRNETRKTINLILENNHYNLILSLTAAFSSAYFCDLCKKRFSNKEKHVKCPYTCPNCHSTPPCTSEVEEITCEDCHRTFKGIACLNTHKDKLCSKLHRCLTCLNSYWTKDNHKCGYKYCPTCLCVKPVRHNCYMQPNRISDKVKKSLETDFLFVFYDFECMQEKELSSNIFLHEPNLCVVQQVCSNCITVDNIDLDCNKCGKRKHIFSEDPVGSLLNFLHEFEKKKFNVFALAHNLKSYDGCFITKHVFKDVNRWNPTIIRNGCKFVSITCNKIKFIDSLNYMPLPLNKLPNAFKFDEVKGYFPHLFNRRENSDYVGSLPDPSFYMPDSMTLDARNKFFEWYNKQISNKVVFNFKNELIKYCILDVDILRKSCIKFRECFIKVTNIDPFQEATTIASVCNKVFRRNFLQPETIGIIPPKGYRMTDNCSEIALKWLCWKESLFPDIIHAGNGQEIRLKENLTVDGFCATTNTVFEFDGCYFHGCEKCYPHQTTSFQNTTDKNDSMFTRRDKTIAKHQRIRNAGYNFVTIRECDFKEMLRNDAELRDAVNNNFKYSHLPLNPRDSFFGGRTNAIKLYHKISNDDESILYFDICSLYPFINKYKKYPIGHPKIHIGNEACRKLPLDTVEGLIKCTVLPPRHLYHPVLPYKCNGKLMFPLCKACVESLNQEQCLHTEEERQFTGTFVVDELRKAISLNYKILEIYEVWEYKVKQFDKDTKSGGLFSKYVDTFLKIKQECSDWPKWCKTDEDKISYIVSYLEREGIKLDESEICHNAGLRFIAKLMLNSFWGKFGQRANLMQTAVITKPFELFTMLTDPSVIVNNMVIVSEEMLLICWTKHEDAILPLNTVNVAIAAYTTAMARLELYSYLEKLGKRVLYFDTDSVIFTYKKGEWKPEVGDYLGMLTDEVAEYGPGSKITEFVSGGPKNYAYKVYIASTKEYKTICKVKGITLNALNSESVNFEQLKAMVCDNAEPIYVHNNRKICITADYDVISRPESKIYRIGYTKRRRIENNYDTLPYGFLEVVNEESELNMNDPSKDESEYREMDEKIPFYMDGWTL
ncbi:unnamed protein product [Brassicogethes aeneus]|uniref:DNA-directed DNA polymerase n=1 Tax=Brassicogethes aeneus TaxID=1431903 RepID=A0A9P0FJ42_BRAAE|nr:unnamed protein product [Brassicogethes aeneus]